MIPIRIAPGMSTITNALSATLPETAANMAELITFLQEVPLVFIVAFVALCLFLVSKYLLPK